jgi:LmbE family N-acetylglucosaminyl deacetylase
MCFDALMEQPRLLVNVAHPDDETFGCGSILLHAAARGVVTFLCCATRGEAGEPAPGSGITQQQLPAIRERELHEAATFLGVADVELLGYRDSGMDGTAPAGALIDAPIEAVAAELATVIDRIQPHVVVTLDASDGHRDHAHIRDATLAAVEDASWSVARVYLHGLPRSLLRQWADHMRAERPDSPYLDVDGAGLGTPDASVTTVVDVAAHLDKRRAAIAIHASQVSPFAALPHDLARAFLATDHLRRVVPPFTEAEQERDLFAGLP